MCGCVRLFCLQHFPLLVELLDGGGPVACVGQCEGRRERERERDGMRERGGRERMRERRRRKGVRTCVSEDTKETEDGLDDAGILM